MSLPPINNSEEQMPLEVWPTLYLPTSMQVSVSGSSYSDAIQNMPFLVCEHVHVCVCHLCVCGFVSKYDKLFLLKPLL